MAVAAVPTQSTQSVDPALHIHTIPMEFYGGKNPAPAGNGKIFTADVFI